MNIKIIKEQVNIIANLLCKSRNSIALTGAGISIASGIPAFRGARGLWNKYNPVDFASIDAFLVNPVRVWNMFLELDNLVYKARPNLSHFGLSILEKMGVLHAVVTQNVDGLHQAAGSKSVIEYHGSGRRFICYTCRHLFKRFEVDFRKIPPRCFCGGVIKPDFFFFNEPIPIEITESTVSIVEKSQLILIIGTSALVAPVSYLPISAKNSGVILVEINLEETSFTRYICDLYLHLDASIIIPLIVKAVADRLV